MFKKDRDQFWLDNEPNKFKRHIPQMTHRRHPPPPFREAPNFGPHPPFPGPHPRPPLPMSRKSFQEIRDYMLLLIISEYSKGITGYQLQEKYNFPRGTLIRTLQDLETKGYLDTREEIIEGRANKFYFLTENGKKFLEELKLKWANLFGMMAEINPPEGMKMMIFEKIEEFESIKDALFFFNGLRSWMKEMLLHIEDRINKFKSSKEDLDNLIKEIESMDSLNKQKIRKIVINSINKMEE